MVFQGEAFLHMGGVVKSGKSEVLSLGKEMHESSESCKLVSLYPYHYFLLTFFTLTMPLSC